MSGYFKLFHSVGGGRGIKKSNASISTVAIFGGIFEGIGEILVLKNIVKLLCYNISTKPSSGTIDNYIDFYIDI